MSGYKLCKILICLPKSQQFWLNGLHKQKTSFVNIDEALKIEFLTING